MTIGAGGSRIDNHFLVVHSLTSDTEYVDSLTLLSGTILYPCLEDVKAPASISNLPEASISNIADHSTDISPDLFHQELTR